MAMSSPRRMRLWGLAVAAGHVVLGLVGDLVLHVPGALLFFGLCAALTLAVALARRTAAAPAAPAGRPRRPAPRRPRAAAVVARVRARFPRVRVAPAHARLTSRRSAS